MPNNTLTKHITPEELIDYFEGVLPEDRDDDIEEHFALCDQCTHQARQFQDLSHAFEGWTAKAHGEAYLRALMEGALQEAEDALMNAAWKERVRKWREQWSGKAQAAVRVVIEVREKAIQVVSEDLGSLLISPGHTQPLPAGGTVRTRGTARPSRVRGAPDRRKQIAPSVTLEGKELVVRVKLPPEPKRLAVFVVQANEGYEVEVKELQHSRRTNDLVARFEAVEATEYVVLVEPAESDPGAPPS